MTTHKPREFMPAEIELTSGGWFDLAEPERSRFTLLDVATAIARLPRFTGQGAFAYSVAEHSVLCSYLVPPRHALDALVHDAHEGFVGDVTSPLKAMCPDYAAIEKRAAAHVIPALGGRWPLPYAVKVADLEMLAAEKRHVLKSPHDWPVLAGVSEPRIAIAGLGEAEARAAWLERYAELTPAA